MEKMNLFIDTNILLNFYHYSGDDLAELDKLVVLLRNNQLVLFLPSQIEDEFFRNRDNKIADAIKEFKKAKIDKQFPQMTKQYDEYKKMREAIKSFEENKFAILEKLKSDVVANNLKADKVIQELFDNSTRIPTTKEIIDKAKLRFDLGNPPGKNKSYGDAINWEALISEVKEIEDIFFITDDSDYVSGVDNNNFNPYLLNEWSQKKFSKLYLYKNLTSFLMDKFPEIKLVDEYEKDLLIEKLSKSGNFSSTHSILAQLSKYNSFTKSQVDEIIFASVSNPQIYWIAKDYDVNETLNKIVESHSDIIESDLLGTFNEYYNTDYDVEF